MAGDLLRWSAYREMPWKNGGGSTREVASGAPGESADGFDWRVSVADVAAGGPFSAFPGIDRVITLVENEGMVLTVDGTAYPVAPLRPFAFSGDAATDCRLEAGPVRDMNVMTRRGRATAEVHVLAPAATDPECAAGETRLLMALTEGVTLTAPDGAPTPLGRLDCVRHEGPGRLELRGGPETAVADIRITTTG